MWCDKRGTCVCWSRRVRKGPRVLVSWSFLRDAFAQFVDFIDGQCFEVREALSPVGVQARRMLLDLLLPVPQGCQDRLQFALVEIHWRAPFAFIKPHDSPRCLRSWATAFAALLRVLAVS